MNMQQLAYTLDFNVKSANDTLAKFQQKLADDPAYAFSWASDAMTAAAKLKVANVVLASIEKFPELTIEMVRKEAATQMRRAARYPARSTSPVSNVMEQEIGAAWAELFDTLENA